MTDLKLTSAQPRITAHKYSGDTVPQTLKRTIELIGEGIRAGTDYLPIRQIAATLASRADPKDYLGQVKNIWDYFVTNWRYVNDPIGGEQIVTSGPAIHNLILGKAIAGGRGIGDCDDASVGCGALLSSIGRRVVICTTAGPKTARHSMFSHVYLRVKVPKHGWIPFDPVVYPKNGFGYEAPYVRIAMWDLNGKLIGKEGHFPSGFSQMLGGLGAVPMSEQTQWQDVGLEKLWGSIGSVEDDGEPLDWSVYGLEDFGMHVPSMGMIGGEHFPNIQVEVTDDDVYQLEGIGEVVRTPMLEMDPDEFNYITQYGAPRVGALALSDKGEIYQWVPEAGPGMGGLGELGGWFKKLFKKIKKGVRKVAKKIGKGIKKLVRKLPGGKWLIKMYGKVKRVAMKLVRPLVKFVGKYAKKLAPIAAFIPGVGPAISGALYTAGKIAKVLQKTGVVTDKKGRPKFKSDKHAKRFRKELKREASIMQKKMKSKRRKPRRGRRPGRLRVGAPRRRFAFMRSPAMMRLQQRFRQARMRRAFRPKRIFRVGTPEHFQVMRGLGFLMDDEDQPYENPYLTDDYEVENPYV